MNFGKSPQLPTVDALPTSNFSTKGRIVRLSTTGRAYHDTGNGWDDLTGPNQQNISFITGSIANLARYSAGYSFGYYSFITRIAVSVPCWVVVYSSLAYMTADASRLQTADPSDDSGVILEYTFEASKLSYDLTPAVVAYNADTSRANNIYVAIQNRSGITQAVTATVTRLAIEV